MYFIAWLVSCLPVWMQQLLWYPFAALFVVLAVWVWTHCLLWKPPPPEPDPPTMWETITSWFSWSKNDR